MSFPKKIPNADPAPENLLRTTGVTGFLTKIYIPNADPEPENPGPENLLRTSGFLKKSHIPEDPRPPATAGKIHKHNLIVLEQEEDIRI